MNLEKTHAKKNEGQSIWCNKYVFQKGILQKWNLIFWYLWLSFGPNKNLEQVALTVFDLAQLSPYSMPLATYLPKFDIFDD